MITDWTRLFTFDVPVLEIFIRGTCVYIALLLMLRFCSKREAGSLGLADMLVIVVIADAAQNAMSGTYISIASGLELVATILFWDYVLNWLSFRFPKVEQFMNPAKVCLIRNGRILWRNLRHEMISEAELKEQLRIAGVQTIESVKHAFMESNGKISIQTFKDA